MAEKIAIYGEPVTSVDKVRQGWEKTEYILEPLIHTLPKRDRVYFQSIVRFLIGKDVALANIQPRQMHAVMQAAQNILLFITYMKLGGNMIEYIDRRISEYENLLKVTMADRALFLKYWTGSIQSVTQRLVTETVPEEARQTSGRGVAPQQYREGMI